MTLGEWIQALWPIILFLLGLVWWSSAQQSAIEANTKAIVDQKIQFDKELAEIKKSHADTKADVWAKMDDIQKTMTEILRSLSKIQGNLEGSQKHGSDS